jgi:serine/threonine protein kinase
MQLDTGVCVSCLLRKGLEGGDEVSQASYRSVLAEVDAPHKAWFLGNYEILEQIGCGGMGVIYRARQRHSQRIVAVKRVLSYRADSHEALQRFRREAQAVASLDHSHILPIYEVSESEDGLPFFSMKFAEKGSLHENLASLREQPRKCVELMAKVAGAVEYAHSRGVLHRDIKPGNILLNDRGEPLVSDFGLAKLLDENNDLTRSLTTFGTAGFIAPEQAGHAAGDFTPVADVYSLGAVLFTLLAGRPPFLGSNPVSVIRQASETQAPKLRSLAPSLDRDLETICARCLERDPRVRYQSAGDLGADMERWLGGHPIVARPVSPPARMWRWSRRNPKLVGAATAGLLLGAAVVWLSGSMLGTLKNKSGTPVSIQEQTKNGADNPYLQKLFTGITYPTGVSDTDRSVSVRTASNPFTLPDYTSPGDFDVATETRMTAAPAGMGASMSAADRRLEGGPEANKITVDVLAAPPGTGLNISVRDRASEANSRTDKITPDVTTAPRATAVTSSAPDRASEADPRTNKIAPDIITAPRARAVTASVRDRASEAGARTSKITPDGAASIQGVVKDAKGEPIKGADVRIESRDGKHVFSTVKTDPKGRYNSQGLRAGDYRVTLLLNGAVKASISNAQTKANQPTQLNFDFKPGSQTRSSANGRKHVVWVPNRTGSHIGGNWVEVDDEGNPHFDSNVQTYSVRR